MAEGFEIRERTLPEKLSWYAALIEDAGSRQELVAAAVQLPALLREAAAALIEHERLQPMSDANGRR